MFFMFPVFTSLVSLVSPLAFYEVPLKILPRVYCAKAKEKLLGYARARSLKEGQADLGSHWAMVAAGISAKESQGETNSGLPTWRSEDSY